MTDPNPLTPRTLTIRILLEDMKFHCQADGSEMLP
jgi:hypothetical protein